MRIALAAAALVLLASPALAQTEVPATPAPAVAPEPEKAAKDDPNRLICKSEREMGSNRPKKVCKTAAERQRLKEQADKAGGMDGRKPNAGSRGAVGN